MNWRLAALIPLMVGLYNARRLMAWEVTPTPIEFATYVLPWVGLAALAYFAADIVAYLQRPGDAPQPPNKPPGASGPFPASIARTLTLADQHKRDGLQAEAYAAGQIACDLIEREYPPIKQGDTT